MPDDPEQAVVNVIITEDHVAVMDPPVPLLEPLFSYRRRKFVPEGPLGYRELVEEVSLCEFDHKGRLAFSAGLLHRVRRVLSEHGYQVQLDDQRKPGPRLRVDEEAISDSEGKQKLLLQALAREPLGRVEVSTYKDVLEKMSLVGKLYPRARVAVAVPTRRQAWKVRRDLEEILCQAVGLALSGRKRNGRRWLVGTFQSIPRKMAGKYDVLLLPFGEESTGVKACEMVAEMGFKRRYAFVRPQFRADSLVEMSLEQVTGEVIHRLRKARVPVRVLMLPTNLQKVECGAAPLERKKSLYWLNQERNEYVARLAQAVYSLDKATLKTLGLRNKDIRAIRKCDKAKLKLLVETPEHARELLALLPGWRMGGINQPVAVEVNLQMPVVMAAVYASEMDIKADVIVRATGTEWAMRVKNFPPRVSKKTPPEVVVLDFADEYHPSAREDAKSRVKGYKRQGMAVHELHPGAP